MIFILKCVYNKNTMPAIFQTYFSINTSVHSHTIRKNINLVVVDSLDQNQIRDRKCTNYLAFELWNSLLSVLKSIMFSNVLRKKCWGYIKSK